jgi:hypothetical protein
VLASAESSIRSTVMVRLAAWVSRGLNQEARIESIKRMLKLNNFLPKTRVFKVPSWTYLDSYA